MNAFAQTYLSLQTATSTFAGAKPTSSGTLLTDGQYQTGTNTANAPRNTASDAKITNENRLSKKDERGNI